MVEQRSGHQGVDAVTQQPHGDEEHAEHHQLLGGVAAIGIDELGQKSE